MPRVVQHVGFEGPHHEPAVLGSGMGGAVASPLRQRHAVVESGGTCGRAAVGAAWTTTPEFAHDAATTCVGSEKFVIRYVRTYVSTMSLMQSLDCLNDRDAPSLHAL